MSITAKFGFRHYEFENERDFAKARNLWPKPGNQEDFEDAMKDAGVEFHYDFLVTEE